MPYRARDHALLSLLVSATVSIAAAACSSDDGSSPPGSGGSGSIANGGGGGIPPRGSGSVYEDLGIEDPQPDEHYFNEVSASYDDVEGCKAFTTAYPDIHSCSCDNCYDIQRQCDSLEGCQEISECGISIGCSDAFSCYLAPADAKCVPIIDKWGNTGVSAALSLRLGECTRAAGCL
jgi:hypothetical protein